MREPGTLQGPLLDRYDLLIVGGGIYGASALYEAARRGLSALLVERDDYGAASSFNSMKIVHGGLRYLQEYDLGRLLRSHRELRVLLDIAPGLVQPLACRLAVEQRGAGFRLKFRAGLLAYSLLKRAACLGLRRIPPVPPSHYPCWHDGFVPDTERLLLSYLHTAVRLGEGRVATRNYSGVESCLREQARVVGANVSGLGEVRARAVIETIGTHRPGQPVGLSMNLIVGPLEFPGSGGAVGLPHPTDGRFVFVVPWRDRHIVGTYDRSYPYDPAEPLRVERAWLEEFLAWLAPVHPELARLDRPSIHFLHAGLLPKDRADDEGLSTADRVTTSEDGIVRVRGSKYTTARAVASKAVERAMAALGLGERRDRGELPALDDRETVLNSYLDDRPELNAPVLPGDIRLTRGAVRFAVANEQARTLSDVLLRRSGVASAGHPGAELVEATAARMQAERGWTDVERRDEIERFEAGLNFCRDLG